jgi:RNA polymerase sigma factor (sigma-70 family)
MTAHVIENLLRELTPQVLGTLVRRYGQFDGAEDAVQEAILAAAVQWPAEGMPDNPRSWLVTVASRRFIDQIRSDHARRERESATATEVVPQDIPDTDDTLVLLFLCCHPTLTAASQTALTLRAVGGLTTAEIARAFLVPEATMAARISRAKQRIKAAGSSFSLPAGAEREERLRVVLHVLYLIFNEGYTASSGNALHRADLAHEAIRLTRMVHAQLPEDGEVAGLLALMLLTDARREARTTAAGDLVPLDEQDRTKWDRGLINEGVELVKAALAGPVLGPYQLQAAIAATHADAGYGRGNQLAPGARALPGPGTHRAQPDGHPQPGHRARRNRGPGGRAGPAVHIGRGRTDGRAPPAAVRAGAPAGEGRRRGRSVRALPARREVHRQHRRATIPGGPRQPGEGVGRRGRCAAGSLGLPGGTVRP